MHALQLGVLGPLQISVAGRVVELRRAKQRSLLALLLLTWARSSPPTASSRSSGPGSRRRRPSARSRTSSPSCARRWGRRSSHARTGLRARRRSRARRPAPLRAARRRAGEVKDPELRANTAARGARALARAAPRGPCLEPFARSRLLGSRSCEPPRAKISSTPSSSWDATPSWSAELEALVAEHPFGNGRAAS